MASENKVIIIGNLGRDPELRAFSNGGQICTVSVATSERWKDKNSGEQKEHTEWHSVVFSDRLAEIVSEYCQKGTTIYIEGSLRTRKWQDKDGQDRYTTEIRAHKMQILSGGRGRDGGGQRQGGQASQGGGATSNQYQDARGGGQTRQQQGRQQGQGFADMDDDIPF